MKKNKKKKIYFQRGQAALITAIFFMVASLAILTGFSALTLNESRISRIEFSAKQSYFTSEAGQEDAVYRIMQNKQISSTEIITLGGASASTTITDIVGGKDIASKGDITRSIRSLKTVLQTNTSSTQFLYGIQVGNSGLFMENGSRVNGSVYSNGSITGDNGALITGDALVAQGTPPTLNQNWETYNTDYGVGQVSGSIITTIDSIGDVGTYTSLAMGSDGFARISYIDGTNDDLKFARCTNNSCTSANLAIVDSAGSVDEVTSLTLGSDGFGRISYYHDGNDDLKFTQCTNADCSSANVRVIDATSNMGDFSSIQMGLDGFPRIGYWYDSSGDVKYAKCNNAACSSATLTSVVTSGSIGEYISLAIGSDGFGRMSYYDATNGDLIFLRCTNDICSTKIITTVDSAGDVGKYTSLKLGSDGYARISYFDETNDDLKFARCLDDNCTTKNLTAVDTVGTVGHYTSLAVGSDGFARIAYYDSSNGDLKFTRCTDIDCTTKMVSRVDNGSSVGKHASLALGPDEFGRISYYAEGLRDLKFVRCTTNDCPPMTNTQIDTAQSFQPTIQDRIVEVQLYLKKVGNPAHATVRLVRDASGSPSTASQDVLTTGVLNASAVNTTYGWIPVYLLSTPILNANTTYWIVIDTIPDNSNYFLWGGDSNQGYTRGMAKYAVDWTIGGWTVLNTDLNFRVYMDGTDNLIDNVDVGGNASAHIVQNLNAVNVNSFTFTNGTATGSVQTNVMSNCTVLLNASYNSLTNCTVSGSQTTPSNPPADLPPLSLPISTSTIASWKNEAVNGGTCVPPQCQLNGDFDPTDCQVSLGPKKITGNMILDDSCAGGQTLTITGTIWVVGNLTIDNNAKIKLAASYGEKSGLIITDGWIHLSNNGQFSGSGTSGSYPMFLSTVSGGGHHGSAIDLHNNASGAIFYAANGTVWLHNNVAVMELVGYGIHLDNNAVITYDAGLANVQFSSGPQGGWSINTWQEVP